ncbi:MAG: SurA N-terminal domain-containing protein [Fimbriimonadales bacterium]|nr:SurA N-terminal domain-containing protein [Fimbriimonadales bacterium]
MNKTALLACVVAMVAVAGCGSKGGGGDVATVNGEPISKDEFVFNLDMKPTVRVMTQAGPVEAPVAGRLGFQVIQDLILRKATLQLAKDEGVYPSDKEVDEELKLRTKLNPNFVTNLTKQGLTLSRIKESLRFDLAREKLLTKGITVTRAEAEKYVKEHPNEFMEPETADMTWIFVKDEAAKAKVDRELAAGQGFSFVAIQYSQDPNVRRTNGRFPERIVNNMAKPIQDLVRKTPENKATAWLRAQDGWAKFYIDKKTPAKPIVMDDAKYTVLQRTLARQRGEAGTDLGKRILEKLKSSKIEVTDPALKELWKEAYDNLIKQAKDNPSATTPASPTAAEPKSN